MNNVTCSIDNIPDNESTLLFIDWLIFLLKNDLTTVKLSGHSAEHWDIEISENEKIAIQNSKTKNSLEISYPQHLEEIIIRAIQTATHNIKINKPRPNCWWVAHFSSDADKVGQRLILHLDRHIGVHTQRPSTLRMANYIFLKIDEQGTALGFPKLGVDVFIKCDGAAHGPYSRLQMIKTIPVIGAILSCCFGTPLTPSLIPFSVNDQIERQIEEDIQNPNICELDFHDLPIMTLIGNMIHYGADELADRVIGAFMAYECGMLQRTDHATIIFFISAIESLTTPNLDSAKKQRLSKRFSAFLEEFCSEAIENAMNHPNFKQAFGNIKNKKKFIENLYDLRSKPVHTGHLGNYSGMINSEDALRVAILNDIVKRAIATFLRRPVTLLWGHPEFDPSITLRLNFQDHQKLIKKATNHHTEPEIYIKNLISNNINKSAST